MWTLLQLLAGLFAAYAFILEANKHNPSRLGLVLVGTVAVINIVQAFVSIF